MQKEADPFDSFAEGIELRRRGFGSTSPLRFLYPGVSSEVTTSALELPLEAGYQDVTF